MAGGFRSVFAFWVGGGASPEVQDNGALSATGTGTGTFVGASQSDSVLSATGTGTALFVGASNADAVLSATGTGTATFTAESTADSVFSVTGTATVAFIGESFADSILAATGTATVLFVAEVGDAALSIDGSGTAAFAGESVQTDSPFSMTGTGAANFVGAFTGGQVQDGGGFIGHRGSAYWKQYQDENEKRKKKKRKKQDALEELDTLLVAVKAQITPWEKPEAYQSEQALYRNALERAVAIDMSNTVAQIEAEIVNLKELLAEQDEEEALLMLLH